MWKMIIELQIVIALLLGGIVLFIFIRSKSSNNELHNNFVEPGAVALPGINNRRAQNAAADQEDVHQQDNVELFEGINIDGIIWVVVLSI